METFAKKTKRSRKANRSEEETQDSLSDFQKEDASSLLFLQRTVGNQAVQKKLQRKKTPDSDEPEWVGQRVPEGGEYGAKKDDDEKEIAGTERPMWLNVSSTERLPGDGVAEVSKWKPPYTQENKQFLLNQLLKRNEDNLRNGMKFVHNFSSSFLKIWSEYVTDEMAKVAKPKDPSFWKETALFIVETAVLGLFTAPFAHTLEKAGWKLELLYHRGAEYGGEVAKNRNEKKEAADKEEEIEQRKDELQEDTEGIAEQFADVLTTSITPLVSGFYYTQWLEEAPLIDLDKFSLPPLIPEKSKGDVNAVVAQSIGAFYNQKEGGEASQKSQITMSLFNSSDGTQWTTEKEAPTYTGPKFIAKYLRGKAMKNMPNLPLKIDFKSDGRDVISAVEGIGDSGLPFGDEPIFDMEFSWPYKAPINIERDESGSVTWWEGGMAEMIYLYKLAHPDENLALMLVQLKREMLAARNEPFERARFIEKPQLSFLEQGDALGINKNMGGPKQSFLGEEDEPKQSFLGEDEGSNLNTQGEEEPQLSYLGEEETSGANQKKVEPSEQVKEKDKPKEAGPAAQEPAAASQEPEIEAEAIPNFTPAEAAKQFYDYLAPGVTEGIQVFLQNDVGGMRLWNVKE